MALHLDILIEADMVDSVEDNHHNDPFVDSHLFGIVVVEVGAVEEEVVVVDRLVFVEEVAVAAVIVVVVEIVGLMLVVVETAELEDHHDSFVAMKIVVAEMVAVVEFAVGVVVELAVVAAAEVPLHLEVVAAAGDLVVAELDVVVAVVVDQHLVVDVSDAAEKDHLAQVALENWALEAVLVLDQCLLHAHVMAYFHLEEEFHQAYYEAQEVAEDDRKKCFKIKTHSVIIKKKTKFIYYFQIHYHFHIYAEKNLNIEFCLFVIN